ncbi:hypothetical protein OWR28_26255 [Chryseobacterium sp. 1B4]
MARRLWNIITVPAGVIMAVCGLVMIFKSGADENGVVPLKTDLPYRACGLPLLVLEKVLHLKELHGDTLPIANIKLRQANEIATFILFLVVFTVILKSMVIEYWWQLITGFSFLYC